MQKEAPPFVWAAPDEKNILHCKRFFCYTKLTGKLITLHLGNYIIVGRSWCYRVR